MKAYGDAIRAMLGDVDQLADLLCWFDDMKIDWDSLFPSVAKGSESPYCWPLGLGKNFLADKEFEDKAFHWMWIERFTNVDGYVSGWAEYSYFLWRYLDTYLHYFSKEAGIKKRDPLSAPTDLRDNFEINILDLDPELSSLSWLYFYFWDPDPATLTKTIMELKPDSEGWLRFNFKKVGGKPAIHSFLVGSSNDEVRKRVWAILPEILRAPLPLPSSDFFPTEEDPGIIRLGWGSSYRKEHWQWYLSPLDIYRWEFSPNFDSGQIIEPNDFPAKEIADLQRPLRVPYVPAGANSNYGEVRRSFRSIAYKIVKIKPGTQLRQDIRTLIDRKSSYSREEEGRLTRELLGFHWLSPGTNNYWGSETPLQEELGHHPYAYRKKGTKDIEITSLFFRGSEDIEIGKEIRRFDIGNVNDKRNGTLIYPPTLFFIREIGEKDSGVKPKVLSITKDTSFEWFYFGWLHSTSVFLISGHKREIDYDGIVFEGSGENAQFIGPPFGFDAYSLALAYTIVNQKDIIRRDIIGFTGIAEYKRRSGYTLKPEEGKDPDYYLIGIGYLNLLISFFWEDNPMPDSAAIKEIHNAVSGTIYGRGPTTFELGKTILTREKLDSYKDIFENPDVPASINGIAGLLEFFFAFLAYKLGLQDLPVEFPSNFQPYEEGGDARYENINVANSLLQFHLLRAHDQIMIEGLWPVRTYNYAQRGGTELAPDPIDYGSKAELLGDLFSLTTENNALDWLTNLAATNTEATNLEIARAIGGSWTWDPASPDPRLNGTALIPRFSGAGDLFGGLQQIANLIAFGERIPLPSEIQAEIDKKPAAVPLPSDT